jgi:tetratricopeptide (TPR) repeat protein
MINASIAEHRSQARAHENAEQWAQAVAEYEAALELDDNLVFAREGLDYAQRRLQLDGLIEQALDDPARLGEPEILEYTTEVYETAASLDEQGPRLERQLDELDDLLAEARELVEVRIRSDNETSVTVYQVGELGTFENMALELRPGRYVAVGTRPGYRDVRREFVVGFGNEPGLITVECSEQVLTTGRR